MVDRDQQYFEICTFQQDVFQLEDVLFGGNYFDKTFE